MKSYLTNLLPRLQQYSQSLDRKELLVDQPWVLLDENSNKQQYIFERDGKLIMSLNGKVQYGMWRYIAAAKSLVIDRGENDSLLLNHTFVSQGACILKKDGFTDDPWILVNERVVPDLNLERYLRSLIPELKSFKELKLEGCTLYYDSSIGNDDYPSVGLSVKTFAQDDKVINGIFKDTNNLYYVIENDIIQSIYTYQLFETDKGRLKIKQDIHSRPKKGDNVTIDDISAPNGQYHFLKNPNNLEHVIIKDGSIDNIHYSIPYFWIAITIFLVIIVFIFIMMSVNSSG